MYSKLYIVNVLQSYSVGNSSRRYTLKFCGDNRLQIYLDFFFVTLEIELLRVLKCSFRRFLIQQCPFVFQFSSRHEGSVVFVAKDFHP